VLFPSREFLLLCEVGQVGSQLGESVVGLGTGGEDEWRGSPQGRHAAADFLHCLFEFLCTELVSLREHCYIGLFQLT